MKLESMEDVCVCVGVITATLTITNWTTDSLIFLKSTPSYHFDAPFSLCSLLCCPFSQHFPTSTLYYSEQFFPLYYIEQYNFLSFISPNSASCPPAHIQLSLPHYDTQWDICLESHHPFPSI